jgi:hypothetical protein
MVSAAKQYLDALEIELPTVALNGSFVGMPDSCGEAIYHEPISSKSAEIILSDSWDSDATTIFVDCDRAFARKINATTEPALNSWIVNISELIDPQEIKGMEPTAILIAGHKDNISLINEDTDKRNLGDIEKFFFPSIRFQPMHYLEVRAKGTSKGKGLKMLASCLGVKKEDVFVIGDYLNDISMREFCGFFAAPSNALPEVKKVADYVSPFSNDESAVAEILSKFYQI